MANSELNPIFFEAPTYGSGGDYTDSVAVADVNGDGRLDLVVASQSGNGGGSNGIVGVLLGTGDGTFLPVVTYDSGGYNAFDVAVGDVNGDGKLDLVVANECGGTPNCTTGSVGVLLGNGDGTFQLAVTFNSGGYDALSVAVSDVNGDGKPDVLLAKG